MVQALIEEAEQKDLRQDSASSASFGDRMLASKRGTVEAENGNQACSKACKTKHYREVSQQDCPPRLRRRSRQNERRLMVRTSDLY